MKHYKVIVAPSANSDFVSMICYIQNELCNDIAAIHHVNLYQNALKSLETMPFRNAISLEPRLSSTQSRVERIGNYCLIYQINEESSEVHVVALDYNREDLSKEKKDRRS